MGENKETPDMEIQDAQSDVVPSLPETYKTELKPLEKSKADQIEVTFAPMVAMLKEFESQYDAIMKEDPSEDNIKAAKRLRLDIAKIRTGADKERAKLKQEYLLGGNAVQGVFNILKFAVTEKEEKLKERETHFERLEEERLQKIREEREVELTPYGVDITGIDLAAMTDQVWVNFLEGSRQGYENRIAEEKRARETAEKTELFNRRERNLLVFGDLYTPGILTLDTTDEEFKSILGDLQEKKDAKDEADRLAREESDRLRRENEELKQEREVVTIPRPEGVVSISFGIIPDSDLSDDQARIQSAIDFLRALKMDDLQYAVIIEKAVKILKGGIE